MIDRLFSAAFSTVAAWASPSARELADFSAAWSRSNGRDLPPAPKAAALRKAA